MGDIRVVGLPSLIYSVIFNFVNILPGPKKMAASIIILSECNFANSNFYNYKLYNYYC